MLKFVLAEMRALQSFARERMVESCAVGLVFPASQQARSSRFVVKQLQEVPDAAYSVRTAVAASLKPEYCVEIANRARAAGAGVLLAHTHPGTSPIQGFSVIDDEGEKSLSGYFERRIPNRTHFSAVATASDVFARRLGNASLVSVEGIGRVLAVAEAVIGQGLERHDRQVRAFGADGQRLLERTKVAIVGLGGTGSVVAQQLAHLGVSNFTLIDPDAVEVTNLNRLVGAVADDVGTAKVVVAARHIGKINPVSTCTEIVGDVVDANISSLLTDVDFIFCCTDSMASRAVLNQLAYQYLVPCIDIGVGIGVDQGKVNYITGRTQMLSPGLPCLVCTDKLDAEQVRRELLTEEQRSQDPYITGATVPQPAVISLNTTLSSAAITMFLAAVSGVPSDARMVIYDGIRGSLRPAAMEPRHRCIVCSYDGALALGQTWALPTRLRPDRG